VPSLPMLRLATVAANLLFLTLVVLKSQLAPLAQSAEQLTLNQWVPGSSPGGRTNIEKYRRQAVFSLVRLNRVVRKMPPSGVFFYVRLNGQHQVNGVSDEDIVRFTNCLFKWNVKILRPRYKRSGDRYFADGYAGRNHAPSVTKRTLVLLNLSGDLFWGCDKVKRGWAAPLDHRSSNFENQHEFEVSKCANLFWCFRSYLVCLRPYR
jgi:hypothetical protein